jgi:hypothetical protein
MINFNKLKHYTDFIESKYGYGCEDFSIFLYSLIKMKKPKTIVDFGTGLGSTMLWAAAGCKENKIGKVISIDNGSHWNFLLKKSENKILKEENYNSFINKIINNHNLSDFVIFKNEEIDLETSNNIDNIDIAIFDFKHGPLDIIEILSKTLKNMSQNSIIFIDSASTLLSSYLILEKIINEFNKNIILDVFNKEEKTKNLILSSNFTLLHILENKERNQNSTAMIQITPKSCIPYSPYFRY